MPILKYIMYMKLSWKIVGAISALIIISLTGLVLLQASLLQSAMQLKEQAFRQNVFAAMQSIVQRLEIGEATTIAFRTFNDDSLNLGTAFVGLGGHHSSRDSIVASVTALCGNPDFSTPFNLDHDTLHYVVTTSRHIRIEVRRIALTVRFWSMLFKLRGNMKSLFPKPFEIRPGSFFISKATALPECRVAR